MAGTHTEPFDTISRHNIYWITKAILSAPRCDPNLLDSNDLQTRDTPLTLYLRWHYEKSGVFLKAMVESPKTDVNKRGGAQQQYPLHTAAWLGRLDWVKLLVEHGAKINIQKEKWTDRLARRRHGEHERQRRCHHVFAQEGSKGGF